MTTTDQRVLGIWLASLGRWCLPLLLVLALPLGCGGGGGEDRPPPPDPNASTSTGRGFVSIEGPTEASSFTTAESSIVLSGDAFISPDRFVCCSGSASDTAVTVSWSSSAGPTGQTTQSVDLCSFLFSFFLCDHTWSARIPLSVGVNVIRVHATDGGRNSATDTITVTRLPDSTPPTVVGITPFNGANLPVNWPVGVTFSELMDNSSITPATFALHDSNGISIPGTVTVTDRTATFEPHAFLAGSTIHTATVSTGVRDVAGNALAAAFVWTFETGSADLTRPTIAAVSPPAGSVCSAPDGELNVVFSEPVDRSSVTNLGVSPSFTLQDTTGGPPQTFTISGEVRLAHDGTAAVFDPAFSLQSSRSYTATLTTRIKDLAGSSLLSNMVWTFGIQPPGGGVGVWQPTATSGAPQNTWNHTAVWTGSEMITFGGHGSGGTAAAGGRYAPATDTWSSLPVGGPSARYGHVAVWTGSEMIVWGGFSTTGEVNDGSRYNPTTNAWTPVSVVGAPSGRSGATAVWTGIEMIVWGAGPGHAAYNPATDTWRPLNVVGAPDPIRFGHTAVWTGTRMIIWGGAPVNCGNGSCAPAVVTKGAIYDPVTDAWQAIGTTGEPSNRTSHSAVWTGTEMAIWGGNTSTYDDFYGRGENTGAFYDPSTATWRGISTVCGPAGRYGHSVAWTGSEMIVWGGFSLGSSGRIARNSGARYNPTTNSWQHLATANAPPVGDRQAGVWTGSQLIVWGGGVVSGPGTGGIYSP
jgi:N-acetylneuraminic acid mutarotase